MRYLGSSKQASYTLSENMEDRVETTFSFSLYTTLLQVILVVYFGRELRRT